MNNFEALLTRHEELLELQQKEQDIAEEAQAYIEQVIAASSQIAAPRKRDQLRANLRYWAGYVYDKKGVYPNLEFAPPSELASRNWRLKRIATGAFSLIILSMFAVTLFMLIPVIFSRIQRILLPIPTTPTLTASPAPTDTSTPTTIPTSTLTGTPTPTNTLTSTPTGTPTPTNTPTPTLTKTPMRNLSPLDGGKYPFGEVSLVWAWNGNLGGDGIYSVRVWRKENLSDPCIHTQTEKTEYRFDPNACPGTNEFCWSVQAVRPDGKGSWEPLSSSSKRTCFSIAKSPIPAPILLPIREDNIGQLVSIADIHAHTGPVLQVSFSPDGRLLASSGGDGTFKLWSVPNGELLAEVPDHEGWTQSVSFSPDGKWIASGDSGHTVRLWDANTLGLVAEFAQHEGFVFNCTFSPDSSLIASASGDGTVRLWNIKTGQEQAVLPDSEIAVYEVSFSPDGTKLATASIDGWVQIWDVSTATPFCKRYSASVLSVAFSPDGNSIAAGNMDGHVLIINAANCGKEQVLESHTDNVNAVAYSPGGEILVSGSRDSSVLAWTLSPSPIPIAPGKHRSWVESVAFSPDGSLIASGSADGVVILWGVGE